MQVSASVRALALTAGILCLAACSSLQSRFTPLDGKTRPPREESFQIVVFDQSPPTQPFDRIARLDVHLEKTVWTDSSLKEAMPELKLQARQAGADAIVDIREKRSQVGETRIYHVTATAIAYR